jgi:uncharacterized RDD family membrane protein YckC
MTRTSSAAPLDAIRRVATPEGIELALRLAGPVPRALAWAIDFGLRIAVLILIAMLMSGFGGIGQATMLITWFLLEWIVPAWCEVHWDGATPGKKALGIAVVYDDGRPVRWPAAMTRNLLRTVDFLPFFYGFGLIAILMNRDFKRIGDLAAGTIVVHRERTTLGSKIPNAIPIAPPAQLAVSEQRTVINLAERLGTLTPERAEELAALAPSLAASAREPGAQHLVGIANYLLGQGQAATKDRA